MLGFAFNYFHDGLSPPTLSHAKMIFSAQNWFAIREYGCMQSHQSRQFRRATSSFEDVASYWENGKFVSFYILFFYSLLGAVKPGPVLDGHVVIECLGHLVKMATMKTLGASLLLRLPCYLMDSHVNVLPLYSLGVFLCLNSKRMDGLLYLSQGKLDEKRSQN